MSQLNVFIKQSDVDDDIDVELERAVVHPPSTSNLSAMLSAASTSNLSAAAGAGDMMLDGIGDDAAEAKEERRASSMPKIKKALVGCTVLGVVGTIAGVAIGGAAEYKQQQNAMAAINGGGGTNPSKSGKSGPFCDTAPAVVCGQTVTGTVVLDEDLFCTDVVDGASDDVLKTLNAAIKVEGADAVIDCKGHTVRQLTSKYAASCDESPGPNLSNSNKRKTMKEECDLFYQGGIWLVGGATAINCKVENFYDGFLVQNGGEVKKSEASRNRSGVDILDDSGSGSMTKISDVYAHSNGDGIRIGGSPVGNVVTIEDVTSKNNLRSGMALRGPNIKVKDSTTSHNDGSGIRVVGMEGISNPTKVQFEGTVNSHHNGASISRAQIQIERHLNPDSAHGVEVTRPKRGTAPFYADVTVKGELNTYLNGIDGLHIDWDANMVGDMYQPLGFTVKAKGSFNSCNNGENDIGVLDPGTANANFVDEGTDGYTCTTTGRSNRVTFPTCVDCPDCV